jgi:hypothetical protein
MRPFFCLKPVLLSKLTHPSARDFEKLGYTSLRPRALACPQGCSWSLHFTQVAHVNIVERSEKLAALDVVRHRRPAPRISRRRAAGIVYVDDTGMLGIVRSLINRLHRDYKEVVNLVGLEIHDTKSHGAREESIQVGYYVYGRVYELSMKPEKEVVLTKGLRFAARKKRITGPELEAIVGHCIGAFLLLRLSLSLFRVVYDEIKKYRANPQRRTIQLSLVGRNELRSASVFMPSIRSHLDSPPFPVVMCSDSSDTHWCYGKSLASVRDVFEGWKWQERWRASQEYLAPPTNLENKVESDAAAVTPLIKEWPVDTWAQKQLRASLRITRDVDIKKLVREWEGPLSGGSSASCVIPRQLDVPADLLEVFRGRAERGGYLFWELFASSAELSLWVAHEGCAVVTPLRSFHDPRLHILNDSTYDLSLRIMKERPVRWVHFSVPPGPWSPARKIEDGGPRPFFLADGHAANDDETSLERMQRKAASAFQSRIFEVSALVCSAGGCSSFEAPWDSGFWESPTRLLL